ncbi:MULTISPECIES: ABC transporter ATP-binding protein [unclassified Halomonas]|uniref:ABC transporter ATP-binding protein n=1 Tax=unclassified Halomonas TaxID=2609666 RepID=UPI0028854037|nr:MULTISPECIES: ABC transporter ATP-binding protein [unclassified Halomonas]MDT0501042.1 ABC transporter ATP-binding protein [Halomonas sp. PAR7]MDT0513233.1 ABC transporter ATP-binding protein [Halomonas sp. LES1]MDT0592255.1 ABC transporter ATP-binding protein [Halomonas sp. PAR8]
MLKMEAIETRYGPAQALFGVDLEVEAGQMVALMGRNGMGKTTTIRSLFGLTPAHAGRIRFEGHDLRRLPPQRIARLGLGLVPEGRRCFPNLTVRENLLVAARPGEWTLTRVEGLFPRLGERDRQSAATLSGGEQQMLAIGRALMTNPRLLVLDEATEGLAPVIRQEIWHAIRRLKAQGQAILIVDKTLSELLPMADHCVLLEKGRSAWSGPPEALTESLRDRYLGV